jgi:hypothetical protein
MVMIPAVLARPSSNCNMQTRHLVREGAPHQETPQMPEDEEKKKNKIGRGSQIGA